jgi:pyrroline-5-carboxylate reductase
MADGPVLAFIGGGSMARALIEGAIRAGVCPAASIAVAEPDDARRHGLDALGVRTAERASALAPMLAPATQVLLAVKPQSLADAARDAMSIAWRDRVVITILAGTPSAKVRAALGGAGAGEGPRVVRAMPNLPARIGEGCTAVAPGAGACPGDEAMALRLFRAVGPVVEVLDESLMDAFTAVAGSGPAYLFYLAQAMTRAAVSLGFEASMADRVVRQVLSGSAALLLADPARDAEAHRAAVTSKGGTTEAACRVLDEANVMDSFARALTAARDRGRDLGG